MSARVQTIDRRETFIVGFLTVIALAFMHSCSMDQPKAIAQVEHSAPAPVKTAPHVKQWDI